MSHLTVKVKCSQHFIMSCWIVGKLMATLSHYPYGNKWYLLHRGMGL